MDYCVPPRYITYASQNQIKKQTAAQTVRTYPKNFKDDQLFDNSLQQQLDSKTDLLAKHGDSDYLHNASENVLKYLNKSERSSSLAAFAHTQ